MPTMAIRPARERSCVSAPLAGAREERAIEREHGGSVELERAGSGQRGNATHLDVVTAATERRVDERAARAR